MKDGELAQSVLGAKWVAFDVYATLVDREAGAAKAFGEIARRSSIRRSGYNLFEEWHNEVIRAYRSSANFVSWKDAGREAMRNLMDKHGGKGALDDIDLLFQSFSEWKPYGDVKPVLGALKKAGRRVAVVTNMDTDLFEKTRTGVNFDLVITSEMARAYKPNPRIFEYAIRKMRCEKSEVLWVGTSPWADIQGAKLFGLTMVWIRRQSMKEKWMKLNPWDPTPDYQFDDLYGLRNLLED